MRKRRTARRKEQPPFGAQVAFARVATGLGWTSLGALAVGASAAASSGDRRLGDPGACCEAWQDRALGHQRN